MSYVGRAPGGVAGDVAQPALHRGPVPAHPARDLHHCEGGEEARCHGLLEIEGRIEQDDARQQVGAPQGELEGDDGPGAVADDDCRCRVQFLDECGRVVHVCLPVAVVDIGMPPTHTDEGLVAVRSIRQELPETGVLVLSQYVEPSYALRLIEDHPGRVGYLLKDRVFDIPAVVDPLRRIVDGETVVDPTIVARLVARSQAAGPAFAAYRSRT